MQLWYSSSSAFDKALPILFSVKENKRVFPPVEEDYIPGFLCLISLDPRKIGMSVLSWEEYEKENVLGIVDNLSILLQFPLQTFPVAMSHAEGF